jgi:hypothetical protein
VAGVQWLSVKSVGDHHVPGQGVLHRQDRRVELRRTSSDVVTETAATAPPPPSRWSTSSLNWLTIDDGGFLSRLRGRFRKPIVL